MCKTIIPVEDLKEIVKKGAFDKTSAIVGWVGSGLTVTTKTIIAEKLEKGEVVYVLSVANDFALFCKEYNGVYVKCGTEKGPLMSSKLMESEQESIEDYSARLTTFYAFVTGEDDCLGIGTAIHNACKNIVKRGEEIDLIEVVKELFTVGNTKVDLSKSSKKAASVLDAYTNGVYRDKYFQADTVDISKSNLIVFEFTRWMDQGLLFYLVATNIMRDVRKRSGDQNKTFFIDGLFGFLINKPDSNKPKMVREIVEGMLHIKRLATITLISDLYDIVDRDRSCFSPVYRNIETILMLKKSTSRNGVSKKDIKNAFDSHHKKALKQSRREGKEIKQMLINFINIPKDVATSFIKGRLLHGYEGLLYDKGRLRIAEINAPDAAKARISCAICGDNL